MSYAWRGRNTKGLPKRTVIPPATRTTSMSHRLAVSLTMAMPPPPLPHMHLLPLAKNALSYSTPNANSWTKTKAVSNVVISSKNTMLPEGFLSGEILIGSHWPAGEGWGQCRSGQSIYNGYNKWPASQSTMGTIQVWQYNKWPASPIMMGTIKWPPS